jgi:chromosome segregation ATPase
MRNNLVWLALSAIPLFASAGVPPRTAEAITRAESSIEHADRAEARRYDPGTLEAAKGKLAEARAAAKKGDSRIANRRAEEAELDADLAAARGRSASAKKAVEELRAGLETLRSEIAPKSAP